MQNVYRCSSKKLLHLGESRKCRKGKRVGYCPKSCLCCDRKFSNTIGFAWHCVATQFSVSRHGPQARHTTRPGRAQRAHATAACPQSTAACARATELASLVLLAHVVTRPSDRLGGLGCNRGFLYHDRVLWPYVAIVALCHDRTWGQTGRFGSRQGSMSRHNLLR